tara:strand:+ start:183 stop:437 length:255 start_codon:yes stop_codon:yes gene_type:complete
MKCGDSTVRFNMPTNDGQNGRLVIDGENHELVQRTGFTIACVTLAAGGEMVFRQHSGQPWRLVGDDIESGNPIRLLVLAIRMGR